jgi:hypothetical protein
MDREALALPRLDRLIWGMVAIVAVIVVGCKRTNVVTCLIGRR